MENFKYPKHRIVLGTFYLYPASTIIILPIFFSSRPPLIFLDYIKANCISFHLQIAQYEPLTDKDFLFNHFAIITLKAIISNSFNITYHATIIIIIIISIFWKDERGWIPPAVPPLLQDHVQTPRRGQSALHNLPCCPLLFAHHTSPSSLNSRLGSSWLSALAPALPSTWITPLPEAPSQPSGLSSKVISALSRPQLPALLLH